MAFGQFAFLTSLGAHGRILAPLDNLSRLRDTASGLVILALLVAKQRYALGIATLVIALIPFGDMLMVLRWDGSAGAAFGIHGLTALLVAVTGALPIRERSVAKGAAVPAV
ncbi:DUF4267 domain-containing protein [Nocardia sp. NPDC004654]|uniref:DUF4267 domain-containing protein n=1 Tax=Nocardia sp. NPDC004654 TaxID=3154776 RepID=UPI0033A160CD